MEKVSDELILKLRDPKFYLENFCKIKGKTPGLIPFILNEAQKDLFNTLRKNNRVIALKCRQIGFCLSPDTLVLLADMTWKAIDDLLPGDEIVGIEENVLRGMGSSRKMIQSVVEVKWEVFEDAYEITFDDGTAVTSTLDHRWFAQKKPIANTVRYRDPEWKKLKELVVGDRIRKITNVPDKLSYEDGWFSGIIDGEGSLAKASRTGACLTISQVAGPVWDRMVAYAGANSINYSVQVDKRISGEKSKLGSKPVNKLVISNLFDIFFVLGKLRPSRFLSRRDWWIGKKLPENGNTWRTIVGIKAVGKKRMIDLQTSSKTFIANGYVSHNSTATAGYFYHKTITTPGTTTALVAHKAEVAAEFLDKVKTFWRTSPEALRPKVHYNSRYEMSFPGIDSKILVMSGDNIGRGFTIHNAHLSEVAMWEKPEEMMLAIENAVPRTGQIIVESTPNGVSNLFHRMWSAKDNGYAKREYGWWWIYSEEEIEAIRKSINDPRKFAQEYALEFLASGRQVFDPALIRELQKGQLTVGEFFKSKDGKEHFVTQDERGLVMFQKPVPGRFYVIGADVSEGVTGGDYSTASILDRTTGEQVGFFRGHVAADKFGLLLNKWGRFYNDALMVVEINGHGLTTVTSLKNSLYPNMYFRPVQFDKMASQWSDRLGWRTTKLTRPLMIDDLQEALRDGSIIPRAPEVFDEMLTFIFDATNGMVCMRGYHDDSIFSLAVALQGFKVMHSGPLDQLDYNKYLPSNYSY